MAAGKGTVQTRWNVERLRIVHRHGATSFFA